MGRYHVDVDALEFREVVDEAMHEPACILDANKFSNFGWRLPLS